MVKCYCFYSRGRKRLNTLNGTFEKYKKKLINNFFLKKTAFVVWFSGSQPESESALYYFKKCCINEIVKKIFKIKL